MTISYYRQENPHTCSLAVLRMVLHANGISVSETTLIEKVIPIYGANFKNIWNPTIGKIAAEFGLDVTLGADWPLLKAPNLKKALRDYRKSPQSFQYRQYENPLDQDELPEALPIAYQEMFKAIEWGCETQFGRLTRNQLLTVNNHKQLIQTSVKLGVLYPGMPNTYHSILLYSVTGNSVVFHDPRHGAAKTTSIDQLLKATTDVGAFLIYKSVKKSNS